MMRVLVTGGSGYIGGRLVRALAIEAGFEVTVAGRRAHPALPGVATATVDWSADALPSELCRGQDVIVHLTAMNEPDCEKDPGGALRINGGATLALLRAAQSSNVRRFIYVSTSKVFGSSPVGAIDEASLPRPGNLYAITHRLAEDYVLAAHDKKQLQGVVLRLSNCFGAPADPGVNAWMLIANDLCRQAATTNRIVLKGSGLTWRNFIAMADVVAALRHTLIMPGQVLADGLFHLGGPQSMRIWDFAQRVAGRAEVLFGQPTKTERGGPTPGEQHAKLDWRIGKLMSTGWWPTAAIDHEIDATLRLCRDAFGRAA